MLKQIRTKMSQCLDQSRWTRRHGCLIWRGIRYRFSPLDQKSFQIWWKVPGPSHTLMKQKSLEYHKQTKYQGGKRARRSRYLLCKWTSFNHKRRMSRLIHSIKINFSMPVSPIIQQTKAYQKKRSRSYSPRWRRQMPRKENSWVWADKTSSSSRIIWSGRRGRAAKVSRPSKINSCIRRGSARAWTWPNRCNLCSNFWRSSMRTSSQCKGIRIRTSSTRRTGSRHLTSNWKEIWKRRRSPKWISRSPKLTTWEMMTWECFRKRGRERRQASNGRHLSKSQRKRSWANSSTFRSHQLTMGIMTMDLTKSWWTWMRILISNLMPSIKVVHIRVTRRPGPKVTR